MEISTLLLSLGLAMVFMGMALLLLSSRLARRRGEGAPMRTGGRGLIRPVSIGFGGRLRLVVIGAAVLVVIMLLVASANPQLRGW